MRILIVIVVAGVVAAVAALLIVRAAHGPNGDRSKVDMPQASAGAIRLGVLGDSDSHSYRDEISGVRRGGEHHDVTWQWTEILALTRSTHFDQGEFAAWGSRGILARMRDALGLEAKTPRKLDFRWNHARSGARCANLVSAWPEQARWLASAIRNEPDAWADGIVVLRIGVNDLGQRRHIDEHARAGLTTATRAVIESCAGEIAAAIDVVRDASPTVRIIVVGIADDSSWPPETTPRRSAEEIARIRSVLDAFDARLRDEVERHPGTVFMDDRAWYYDHWADFDADGNAQRSGVSLGGTTAVTNTQGDEPHHLLLSDGHAGTVANAFWLRELIETINRELGMSVPTLTDTEVVALADPDARWGIAP